MAYRSIDIGIAAYNEEENIEKLLDSIMSQKFEEDIKINSIIVVASGCTDRTEELVLEKAKTYPNIKLISEESRKGKASAVNLILENSSANILVFIAADVLLRKNSLNELVKPFKNPNVGATGAFPFLLNDTNERVGYASYLVWHLHDMYSQYYITKLYGELYAIRSNLVKKIPLNINADDLFIELSIMKKGFIIYYARKAKVFIMGPRTVRDFINQRKRIIAGHSQIKKIVKHPIKTVSFLINLKLIGIYLKKHLNLKTFFRVLFSVALEGIAHLFALFNSLRGNFESVWTPIKSTKLLKK